MNCSISGFSGIHKVWEKFSLRCQKFCKGNRQKHNLFFFFPWMEKTNTLEAKKENENDSTLQAAA